MPLVQDLFHVLEECIKKRKLRKKIFVELILDNYFL
jgi:hypothetical protein